MKRTHPAIAACFAFCALIGASTLDAAIFGTDVPGDGLVRNTFGTVKSATAPRDNGAVPWLKLEGRLELELGDLPAAATLVDRLLVNGLVLTLFVISGGPETVCE